MNINPLNILKVGIFLILILFLLIIFHVVVGFLGIQHFYGTLIALLVTLFCIFFKFPLPLSLAAFFGITYVLEWHWIIAIILTLPGLIFITPKKFKNTFNFNTLNKGYKFDQSGFNFYTKKETVKTNVKTDDIIDGEYKVLNDDDKNK